MTHSAGFGAVDRAMELQQAGELNGLGEPKGLHVRSNRIADFVMFNVRLYDDPTDKGKAFSYEDAKAYILAQPDEPS